MNESINQWIDQWINQWITESIHGSYVLWGFELEYRRASSGLVRAPVRFTTKDWYGVKIDMLFYLPSKQGKNQPDNQRINQTTDQAIFGRSGKLHLNSLRRCIWAVRALAFGPPPVPNAPGPSGALKPHGKKKQVNQPINQSIDASINQGIHQSMNRSMNQWINPWNVCDMRIRSGVHKATLRSSPSTSPTHYGRR